MQFSPTFFSPKFPQCLEGSVARGEGGRAGGWGCVADEGAAEERVDAAEGEEPH